MYFNCLNEAINKFEQQSKPHNIKVINLLLTEIVIVNITNNYYQILFYQLLQFFKFTYKNVIDY